MQAAIRPTRRPQRRRRGHPVGRRGQGQDRRLADRPRPGRGALPGRPQRRPHAGHRRAQDGAAADPFGRHARRRGLLHRQRRGRRPGAPADRDRAHRAARRGRALAAVRQRILPADPALSRRDRPCPRGAAREQRQRQDRHHRQGHRPGLRGQGRAPCAARAGPQAPGSASRPSCASCWSCTTPNSPACCRRPAAGAGSRCSTTRCVPPNRSSR